MGITLFSLCVATAIIAYFFYRDWKRRRLIFRMIEGKVLNDIGAIWGIPRNKGEQDKDYRERLNIVMAKAVRERETKHGARGRI